MSLNVWTARSGTSLGTINERTIVDLALPVSYDPLFVNTVDDSTSVSFSVIAGKLPPGLRLLNDHIVGTAFEVARQTEFKFVLRAKYGTNISDRTFSIIVEGADTPEWLEAEGPLPIGPNDAYYILDSSYIEFQLSAIDLDTAAGQELKFFIASGEGELPPGLKLLENGIITGWVQPAFAIPETAGNGFFDTGSYDAVAYDFGYRSTNGYDTYIYDTFNFDYSSTSLRPKKLNRNYEFIVTITDGDSIAKRKFRIYVVGDDFFRADNIITPAGSGTFSADISYVRAPIWTTPSNIGYRRANNYQTIKLDVYEGFDFGPIVYKLEQLNDDLSTSTLPPGMQFDPSTAEVFGVVPYQPAVTKKYQFTVSATRYSDKEETATSKRTFTVYILGEVESVMNWVTSNDLGTIEANLTSTLFVKATSTITDSTIIYVIKSGQLPPGLSLNLDGEIIGKANQYGTIDYDGLTTIDDGDFTLDNSTTSIDRVYEFTVEARDITLYSAISQTFRLQVSTPNDRLYSNISARPYLKQEQRTLFKNFITDSEVFNPNYIYRPNDPNFGVQSNLQMTVYGGIERTTAGRLVAMMHLNHKRKRFNLGTVKSAKAKIPGTNTVVYEVIYIEVLDPLEKDKTYLDFVIKTNLQKPLITVDQNDLYNTGPLDQVIPFWGEADPFSITLDRTDVFAGDPGTIYKFPSSISLWRKRIKELGLSERNYLPLWMRTIQDGDVQELDFVPAIPLCYCKPGTSTEILLNIKNKLYTAENGEWNKNRTYYVDDTISYNGSYYTCIATNLNKLPTISTAHWQLNFNFNQLDYDIDRYTIDSVTDYNADKYLVFRNDRTSIV